MMSQLLLDIRLVMLLSNERECVCVVCMCVVCICRDRASEVLAAQSAAVKFCAYVGVDHLPLATGHAGVGGMDQLAINMGETAST